MRQLLKEIFECEIALCNFFSFLFQLNWEVEFCGLEIGVCLVSSWPFFLSNLLLLFLMRSSQWSDHRKYFEIGIRILFLLLCEEGCGRFPHSLALPCSCLQDELNLKDWKKEDEMAQVLMNLSRAAVFGAGAFAAAKTCLFTGQKTLFPYNLCSWCWPSSRHLW